MGRVRCLAPKGSALKLSAILVHYYTPELALEAVAALRRDAQSSRIELEIVLIDNGSSRAGRALLETLPCHIPDSAGNLGYAGGVNLGVQHTSGDVFVVLNPDVTVEEGCLVRLVETLESGASVAGPRFFLDPNRHWLQPPADRRSLSAELRRVAAQAGFGTGSARRRWRRRAHRFWSAERAYAMPELSGALLAIRRDAWADIGPMDTGFALYFEETDWLKRLASRGHESQFVPSAEAVHLWAQSTRHESRAAAWFEASARRFRRRWYGPWGCRLLEWVARGTLARRQRLETRPKPAFADPDRADWLELSREPAGYPAAGHRLGADKAVVPPPAHLETSDLVLRAVDERGNDLVT